MARAETIIRPRKRLPLRQEEPRPVLQLPLERPVYKDPVAHRDHAEPDTERGVAVIDFFI